MFIYLLIFVEKSSHHYVFIFRLKFNLDFGEGKKILIKPIYTNSGYQFILNDCLRVKIVMVSITHSKCLIFLLLLHVTATTCDTCDTVRLKLKFGIKEKKILIKLVCTNF